MRVQVSQDKAEAGKLHDGFQPFFGCAGQGVFMNGTRRAPPPPTAAFITGWRPGDGRFVDVAHVEPLPKGGRAGVAGVQHFHRHLLVAGDGQGGRRHQSQDQGQRPFPTQSKHVINQAKRANGRARHQPRQRQIKSHRLRHKRQPGNYRTHQIAKIVVADAKASQPGVFRRHGGAAFHRIEEGEIHRLFRGADGRILSANPHPQAKDYQENQLCD